MYCGDSTGESASHSATAYLGTSPWTECVIAGELLDEKFGVGAYTFVNKSLGGTDIGQWCNGDTSIGFPTFEQRVIANPDVDLYIFQLGINDAVKNHTVPGFKWGIEEMYRIATLYGKKVMWCTPNPIQWPGRPDLYNKLWEFMDVIETRCKELSIPVVNHWRAIIATGVWTKFLADGVHPNEECYRFKGQTLFMGLAYML